MSTIKANDIQNASGGIPTVKGQKLIPTAWVNFNGTGTVAIRHSYNVSSITDQGVGRYDVNYATALSHTEYPAFYQAKAVNDNNGDASYVQAYGTTFANVKHYENGTNRDSPINSFIAFSN